MAVDSLPPPETLRQLLDYDPLTGVLTWRPRGREMFASEGPFVSWNKRCAGKPTFLNVNNGRAKVRILDKLHFAHRVIWALTSGEWPQGCIDHINGDALDNRLENLRVATYRENAQNMAINSRNTSGVTGVSERDGKWRAYIYLESGRKNLGTYVDKGAAIEARRAAEQRFGFHPNHGRELV